MDGQRFSILGRVCSPDDAQWQDTLARVHETGERPRCLCMPGGIEMYVAQHRQLVVKRMPETGSQHHPSCPSYELPPQASGLGELLGEAVLESAAGTVTLRVDFPWTRTMRPAARRSDADPPSDVVVEKRRMSMRALMHFLFERAGFNRWTPAMEGKRNQGVLHKYLMEAAADVSVKGEALVDRLYVPEPFSEAARGEVAARRRDKLALLRPTEDGSPLALVLGEFKGCEQAPGGRRVWIRHMPDMPLLIDENTWRSMEKVFAPLLQARDADTGHRVRLMLIALVKARRAYTYEIDAASLMMASGDWIPIEGVHELPLIQALVEQRRRFLKPLRYDARSAAAFPNALLLDAGPHPVPLHVVDPHMTAGDRALQERSLGRGESPGWAWRGERSMPALPPAVASTR